MILFIHFLLWRACNLTPFSPCLTGPVDYPFLRYEGPGFKSPVPIVLVVFNIKSARYLVLFAGKSTR